MSSAPGWRTRKYAGQGNRRPRGVPPQPRHADDGHCHCAAVRQAHANGGTTTITTWPGPGGQPNPIPDRETARQVKNRAYTCAGLTENISLVMSEPGLGIIQLPDGNWGFRFRTIDRDTARAHIDARRARGDQLAYEHVKGEQRPRTPRKGIRQTEAESIAAHAPLVHAMQQAIDGQRPDPVPPVPPAPEGHDAITGQRLRHPGVTVGGETIGTTGQVLMELLRASAERAEADRKLFEQLGKAPRPRR